MKQADNGMNYMTSMRCVRIQGHTLSIKLLSCKSHDIKLMPRYGVVGRQAFAPKGLRIACKGYEWRSGPTV